MTLAYINNQITYILSFYPLFQLGNKKYPLTKSLLFFTCPSPCFFSGYPLPDLNSIISIGIEELLMFSHLPGSSAQRRMGWSFSMIQMCPDSLVPGYLVPCSTYKIWGSSRDIFTQGWPRRTDCPEIGKVSYIKTTPSTRHRQKNCRISSIDTY